ncbi:hypothetical protein amrb99_97680 [Actinomadura sp. RB99]|uniref:hypothetical protein n=1 Tax=Actinomadura sp. RB99 TaxID=2691577 RepID=UPI0016852CDA|nr:hypothetical protein [Actinomadura sp. RB99]MBD2900759.1 hypothetical protein [Actinomadura sp. RB99]
MTPRRVTVTPGALAHRIAINGTDISAAVSDATITLRAGDVPEVDLTLHTYEIDRMDLPNPQIHIPAETRDALILLGWTPPDDGQDEGS